MINISKLKKIGFKPAGGISTSKSVIEFLILVTSLFPTLLTVNLSLSFTIELVYYNIVTVCVTVL